MITSQYWSFEALTFHRKNVSRSVKDTKLKKGELTAQPSGSLSVFSSNFVNKGF
jgi:phenylalanyl-tRNA synthetase alpha subunit